MPVKIELEETIAKALLEYLLTRPMREVEVLVYHLRTAAQQSQLRPDETKKS